MSQFTYSVNSINPLRMLIFGTTGVLLPIAGYFVSIELIPTDFKVVHNGLLSLLIIPVLILSVLVAWLGFKYSALQIEIIISDDGIVENIRPRLGFLPKRKLAFGWQDISNYDLTEDDRGKILNIQLKNGHVMRLGVAYVLNGSDDFDAFYSTFLEHVQNHNTEIPLKAAISKFPDLYQSKTGRFFAWLLLTVMAGLAFLFFYFQPELTKWDGLKLLFFASMAVIYVKRSLFQKP